MGQEEAFVDAARKEEVLKDGIEGFTNVKSLSTASLRLTWGGEKRISPVGKEDGSGSGYGVKEVLLSLGRDLGMTWKVEGRKIWDRF